MLELNGSQIITQIIGFLLMLWVLKKFGWKPLLDLLNARREQIQSEFDSIAAQKEEAQQLSFQYEQKLKEIEADARKRIREAVEEGNKISREIQHNAHTEAKEILQKAKSEVEGEVRNAKNQLKNDMINLVMNVTDKILEENLDATAQKKLITNFIDEAQLK